MFSLSLSAVPQYDLTVRKAFGTSAIRPEGTHPRRVDHAGNSTLHTFAVGNVMSEELMLRCYPFQSVNECHLMNPSVIAEGGFAWESTCDWGAARLDPN